MGCEMYLFDVFEGNNKAIHSLRIVGDRFTRNYDHYKLFISFNVFIVLIFYRQAPL